MSSEQAVQGSSQAPSAAPPPSTGSAQGADINVMMLLMMIEKGTLDSNGQLEKYYAQQQDDGAWEVDLMKAIQEGVSTGGGPTPYKGAEAIIEKYLKDHDMSHFDANQIIAIHGLENMTAGLKSKDAIIAALVEKVEHDTSEYNSAVSDVQHDNDEIHHCEDKLKSWKDIFPLYDEYWGGQLAYWEAKLHLSDQPNLEKWTAQLEADTDSLKANEIDEQVLFSQGVDSTQDRGQQMKATGQYEVQQLQNSNQGIMSFSSNFFVAQQQA